MKSTTKDRDYYRATVWKQGCEPEKLYGYNLAKLVSRAIKELTRHKPGYASVYPTSVTVDSRVGRVKGYLSQWVTIDVIPYHQVPEDSLEWKRRMKDYTDYALSHQYTGVLEPKKPKPKKPTKAKAVPVKAVTLPVKAVALPVKTDAFLKADNGKTLAEVFCGAPRDVQPYEDLCREILASIGMFAVESSLSKVREVLLRHGVSTK